MMFDSKYRRAAMQSWEQSREETKEELLAELHHHHNTYELMKQRIKDAFAGLSGSKRIT